MPDNYPSIHITATRHRFTRKALTTVQRQSENRWMQRTRPITEEGRSHCFARFILSKLLCILFILIGGLRFGLDVKIIHAEARKSGT